LLIYSSFVLKTVYSVAKDVTPHRPYWSNVQRLAKSQTTNAKTHGRVESSFALSLKTPIYWWLALCCITYSLMSLQCR